MAFLFKIDKYTYTYKNYKYIVYTKNNRILII